MKEQESALVKLAELYRDQKYVEDTCKSQNARGMLTQSVRNASGLAEVITMSRAFMSSTAKAKTAKLSEPPFDFRGGYMLNECKSEPCSITLDRYRIARKPK